jgi:hypothetical protein
LTTRRVVGIRDDAKVDRHAIYAVVMTGGVTSRTSAVPSTSGCLFCGSPWGEVRRSDEHVLPQWMRKHESDLLKASQTAYSAGFDLDDTSARVRRTSHFPDDQEIVLVDVENARRLHGLQQRLDEQA